MKVLLVSPLPPPMGGIATLTEKMIKLLSSDELEIECVNVAHKVSNENIRITKYKKFEAITIFFRTIIKVFNKCLRKQCNVIHINSSSGNGTIRDYAVEIISKIFGVPIVLHYHCNLNDAISKSKIANRLYKKCFCLASKIIVLNKESKEFVLQQGYSSSIISNGISNNLISSFHATESEIKSVVFTGRVSKNKGCLELYECAKENPEINFYLAGLIDNEIEEKLRSVDNIKLLGALPHPDVIDLLDTADLFMFPSYSEGFSMSLLEAMARGVPCIATDVGANRDMIENRGGLIVHSHDYNDLIQALKKMKSLKLRSLMSEWNIAKVKNYYTMEKMCISIKEVYAQINQ